MERSPLNIQQCWEVLRVFEMSIVKLNIIDINNEKHVVNTSLDSGLSLMEIVKNAGFSMGNCGGMALCASCHCYVSHPNNIIMLNQKTNSEEDMLDQLHNSDVDKSRLICQIPVSEELNGVTLKIVKN